MPATGQNWNDLKLLLIDSKPVAVNQTQEMLRNLGFTRIETADNGNDGLALIETFADDDPYDLVLCGLEMPVMTGLEMLRQIRATNSDIPFIMLAARADHASVAEAKELAVTGYIKKPFSMNELRTKVEAAAVIIAQRKSEKRN